MQATEEFFRSIWPAEGYKCLFDATSKQHIWFEPGDIHGPATQAVELSSEGHTVYYAVAGFTGRERGTNHAMALKALFLDVDVGAGKAYATQREAVSELHRFAHAVDLPLPVLLSSGYGIHAYWPLRRALPALGWLTLARRLKDLCHTHALGADHAVTADAARVLRIPGTDNYKTDTPRRVRIVSTYDYQYDDERILHVLGGINGVNWEALEQAQPAGARSDRTTDWSGAPEADFDAVLGNCRSLKWAYENQGTVAEPYWYDALGIAAYCVDGDNAAHRLSDQHPRYSREETTSKLRQRREAAGPTTCGRLREHGRCNGCPHEVGSPIVLGKTNNIVRLPQGLETSITPYLDPHHFRCSSIGFEVKVDNPKGKDEDKGYTWVKLARYALQPRLELRQPDASGSVSNYVWMEAHDDAHRVVNSFVVPSVGVVNSGQFATDCSKQGYYLEAETAPSAYRKFHKHMRAWVEEMKRAQGAVVTFRSFGWCGPDTANASKDSFLLGNKLYSTSGIHEAPPVPGLLIFQNDMVGSGSLDTWVRTMDLYSLPGFEAHMFASWCLYGAPLMRFTSSRSAIFHLVGSTGVGKTSLLRSIISGYGRYGSELLLDSNTSTLNSGNKSIGLLNSLPYCKEEVTEIDGDELAQWALALTQGRERGRMTQANTLAMPSTWQTIAITAANLSLREKIAAQRQDSAARLARIWEQEIHLPVEQSEAMSMFRPLTKNYGLAMPIYMEANVRRIEELEELVTTTEMTLAKRLNAQGADRFSVSMMTANIVGATLASELGLCNHDIKRGTDFAVKNFRRLRTAARAETMTPEDTLARFIAEVQGHTLVVEHDNPRANPGLIFDSDNNIIRMVAASASITCRFAKTTGMLYVSTNVIRKWYSEAQINFESDMKELEKAGVLKKWNERVVLTKATKFNDSKQVYCVWLDLTKSATLLEAVTEEQ